MSLCINRLTEERSVDAAISTNFHLAFSFFPSYWRMLFCLFRFVLGSNGERTIPTASMRSHVEMRRAHKTWSTGSVAFPVKRRRYGRGACSSWRSYFRKVWWIYQWFLRIYIYIHEMMISGTKMILTSITNLNFTIYRIPYQAAKMYVKSLIFFFYNSLLALHWWHVGLTSPQANSFPPSSIQTSTLLAQFAYPS